MFALARGLGGEALANPRALPFTYPYETLEKGAFEVEQFVGGVTHRRDHHDDVVAGLLGLDDALGDPADPFGVGHR